MAFKILCNSTRNLYNASFVLNNVFKCISLAQNPASITAVNQVSISKVPVRFYAKGKDRKKDGKLKKIVVDENTLSFGVNVNKFKDESERCVSQMKEDFVKHFSLRTSLGSLDTLPVTFEGTEYTLQDLAQIGRKNPNLFVVSLDAFPQVIPEVIKSIQASGLGLNPQQDGTTLFIPVPKITKEFRETMSKNAKAVFIKTRDSLRDVQNKFIKSAKAKEGVSEDVFFIIKEQLTHMTDLKIAEVEAILKAKQAELLG